MSKKRGGSSSTLAILLALCGVGVLFLGILCFLLYKETETLKIDVENAKTEAAREKKSERLARQTIDVIAPWVAGRKTADRKNISDLNTAELKEIFEQNADTIKKALVQYTVSSSDDQNMTSENAESVVMQNNVSLFDIISEKENQLDIKNQQLRDADVKFKNLDEKYKSEKEQLQQDLLEKQDKLESLENLNQELSQLRREDQTRFDSEIDKFNQEKISLEQKHEKDVQKLQKDNASLLSEVLQLRTQQLEVRKRTQSEKVWEQTKPDGEIINVDNSLLIAYINRGKKHLIQQGMKFEVFQYSRGISSNRDATGLRDVKGILEVVNVDEFTSQCRILTTGNEGLQYTATDPILIGHHISNPIYDPSVKHQFVLVGDFQQFTKEEIIRLIEEDGGVVASEITASTTFLVTGMPPIKNEDRSSLAFQAYEKQIALASQFSVEVIPEPLFTRYLRNFRIPSLSR